MTDEKKYPFCIKCHEEMSSQDSRGWEILLDHPEFESEDIWLCPNCIYKTVACQDYSDNLKRQLTNIENACAQIYYAAQEGTRCGS